MKILFTGATGVLGRAALPRLVAEGHDVTAVSRSHEDDRWIDHLGARPTEVDLFDANRVHQAISGIDTVIHYATAIPPQSAMTKRESWAMNDRLRSEATGLLVDAALEQGVERFVQESITLVYADGADAWLDETATIEPAWDVLDSALTAEAHVDRFRAGGGTGITLRLSRLYGPGGASDEYVSGVRAGKIPIVGKGRNYVSSIHVDDAATALSEALGAPDGVYNISDDTPVTSEVYTESLADLIGAPRPRRLPRVVGRIALGKAVSLLTTSHRVSNRRFREATGWEPAYPSAPDGWRQVAGVVG